MTAEYIRLLVRPSGKIFPSDDILCADVALLVEEMIRVGLVQRSRQTGKAGGTSPVGIIRLSIAPLSPATRSRRASRRHPLPPDMTMTIIQRCSWRIATKINKFGSRKWGGFTEPQGIVHGTFTESSRSPHWNTHGREGREGRKPKPSSVTESDVNPTPYPQIAWGRHSPRLVGEGLRVAPKAGMSDAAPHYLTDETWTTILENGRMRRS